MDSIAPSIQRDPGLSRSPIFTSNIWYWFVSHVIIYFDTQPNTQPAIQNHSSTCSVCFFRFRLIELKIIMEMVVYIVFSDENIVRCK